MANIEDVNAKVEEREDILVLDDSEVNGVKFMLGEYGPKTDFAGLKYTYLQVTDLGKAAKYFTSVNKDGVVEKDGNIAILDCLNAQIKTRIATKVKNTKLPDTGDETQDKAKIEEIKQRNTDGVVFNLDEAKAWRLGERESGLADMLDDARRELMAILLGGQMPDQSLVAKIAELQARIDARKRK